MNLWSYPVGATLGGHVLTERTVQHARAFADLNGNQHGPEIFHVWPLADLNALGILSWVEDAVPQDYTPGEPVDVEEGGTIRRTYPDAQPDPVAIAARQKLLANAIRAERDAKLTACEWMVTRHRDQVDAGAGTTLTAVQYQELLTYRQALRDITGQDGFPTNVVWPELPTWMETA